MEGSVVRDDNGNILVTMTDDRRYVTVERQPACSLGMFFYILDYLREWGFEAA